MNDLRKLTNAEAIGALKLTQHLADLMQNNESSFSDGTDDPELEEAEQSARRYAQRKGGRIYTDDSQDGSQIREQVQSYLRRTKRKTVK